MADEKEVDVDAAAVEDMKDVELSDGKGSSHSSSHVNRLNSAKSSGMEQSVLKFKGMCGERKSNGLSRVGLSCPGCSVIMSRNHEP